MRVLLISMPVGTSLIKNSSMHTMPPMAIYLLASVLKRGGHEVRIVDPVSINTIEVTYGEAGYLNFLRNAIKNTDVICISSNTLNWSNNKRLIRDIRGISQSIKIVLGGLHPSYFYEHIMQTNYVDFILRGEGEISLPELINALELNSDYTTIDGLVYKKNNIIIANEPQKLSKEIVQAVSLPLYDQLPNKIYPMIPIMTSRGCRYGCRFC